MAWSRDFKGIGGIGVYYEGVAIIICQVHLQYDKKLPFDGIDSLPPCVFLTQVTSEPLPPGFSHLFQ